MGALQLVLGLTLALLVAGAAAIHDPAPSPRFTPAGAAVRDQLLGLTWSAPSAQRLSWAEGLGYCAALPVEPSAPRFRLPTLKELQALVDDGRADPAIDGAAFPGTAPEFFWSGTPCASARGAAWGVNFSAGFPNSFPVGDRYLVRCVR